MKRPGTVVRGAFKSIRILNQLQNWKYKRLLKNGKLGIADIAENAGFSDLYYFSRKFKAETGMTPTEYRAQR